jgi:hypothetical protein
VVEDSCLKSLIWLQFNAMIVVPRGGAESAIISKIAS